MSLRDRHSELTRTAILDAGLDELLERGSFDVPVQQIADRAGVSHRTVYRYFDDRQTLLDHIAAHVATRFQGRQAPSAATFDEWVAATPDRFRFVEHNLEVFRLISRAVVADPARVGDHDEHSWQLFRARFSGLSDDDSRSGFAVVRHLLSALSYLAYRERFGLSHDQAVDAALLAARAVMERLDSPVRAGRTEQR